MFIELTLIFYIVSSNFIDVQIKCACEELLIETDCNEASYCYWDQNKCNILDECSIESPAKCPKNINCAYLEGKCTKFTSCDNYIGDKSTCEAISFQCTSLDQKKCQKKILPGCYDFDEEGCNILIGKDGECGYFDGKCQILRQCSDMDSINEEFKTNKCLSHPHSCRLFNSKCTELKCGDIPDQLGCESIQYVTHYDPYDSPWAVQLCRWQDAKCVNAMPNELNESNCFKSTRYSYFWNPKSQTCQGCIGPPNPPDPTPDKFSKIMRIAILMYAIF